MIQQPVAFVTGSTRGIGEACARALSAEGYFVIISSRKRRAEIENFDGRFPSGHFDYLQCDISLPESREAAFEALDSRFGRLDLMVNNAGIPCAKRLDILETTAESVNQVIDTNLKGTFHMCQLAANYMIACRTRIPAFTPGSSTSPLFPPTPPPYRAGNIASPRPGSPWSRCCSRIGWRSTGSLYSRYVQGLSTQT